MRVYDARLGKFLSMDSLTGKFPILTPYQFASNSPIANLDQDGNEAKYYNLTSTTVTTTVGIDSKKPLSWSTKFKNSAEDVARRKAWYQPNGKLGAGTLYIINHREVKEHYDKILKKNVIDQDVTTHIGSMYVPRPPEPTKVHPLSSFSFGLQIFGSGFDPSQAPTSTANKNMTVVSFNYQEFMDMMDPIMIGMDVKGKPEAPTSDDMLDMAQSYGLDKAIEKKKEDVNKNEKKQTDDKTSVKKGGILVAYAVTQGHQVLLMATQMYIQQKLTTK